MKTTCFYEEGSWTPLPAVSLDFKKDISLMRYQNRYIITQKYGFENVLVVSHGQPRVFETLEAARACFDRLTK